MRIDGAGRPGGEGFRPVISWTIISISVLVDVSDLGPSIESLGAGGSSADNGVVFSAFPQLGPRSRRDVKDEGHIVVDWGERRLGPGRS